MICEAGIVPSAAGSLLPVTLLWLRRSEANITGFLQYNEDNTLSTV
ncbi:MAG: hypothetical protein GX262_12605 [Clostridia bacterium]|nr:hypothetical protein [Clostridia bacterium]